MRHYGLQKDRNTSDGIKQVIKNSCKSGLGCLILCKLPGLILIDVLVGSCDNAEDLCKTF